MIAPLASKDPDADLDYEVDWGAWLDGDTLTDSAWVDVTDGITMHDASHTDTVVKFWLSGGETGRTYLMTNRITTAGGRTDDRTFSISVRER